MAEAKITLTAVDQSKAAFDSLKKKLDGLKEQAAKAGGQIGNQLASSLQFGLAGISLAGIFGQSVQAAKEAEQAQARLAAVLKATGGAAGVTKREIDDLADSLAQSTQFDDEGFRNAAAQLLIFRNVQGETFKEVLKLSADVAAFFNEDLPIAAAKLGRSLEDPDAAFGLLRRAGILLTEQQKDMIKTMTEAGNVAGAQRVIIDKLQQAFGGAAQALNTGLSKATSDAAKSFQEFLEALGKTESVGGKAKRGLEGAKTLFDQLKGAVESGIPGVRNLTSSLLGFAGETLGKLNPAIQVTLELFSKLIKAQDDSARRASGIIKGGPLDPAEIEKAAAAQREQQERDAAYVKKKKADEEAAKKAAQEAAAAAVKNAAELDRLRNLSNTEWVRFIDGQIEREQQLQEAEIKNWEEREKADEELRRKGIEGWIRYADAVFEAADAENEAMARIAADAGKASDEAKELGYAFQSAFEDAVLEGKGLREVLQGLSKDIGRIILRKAVTDPLSNAIGDLIKPAGSSGGNLLSSAGKWIADLFRADGGPVSGGSPYIVGERGPELFVPGSSGQIVPNNALGGGPITVINQYVNLAAEISQQIAAATPTIVSAAVAQITDLRRRGAPV